ncbi:hypothetical protein AB595_09040 [Massilia sp. WF1]|uniref:DUF6160 family protein n=1 Tax=unclassified Massilia TaxID=2609279 RepID=UPI00064B2C6A|nr:MULTISPECIES: DUF6160 family protein [unclassified Massilia]ALK96022.1 hypothetical protein AM586_06730 [Massilia sp. WG5]KLU37396.1 hypothetical protein AB595_09040 [Massilia sp. WF1]
MKLLKQLAVVAALSSIASYASALTPIADSDLSKVSGRDGVSIAADLHINIGEFKYTDTDTAGGSVSFNNIKITGAIAATIDIVNNATFTADAMGPGSVLGVMAPAAPDATNPAGVSTGLPNFAPKGDVVKIAIPLVDTSKNLSMSVDSIRMGGVVDANGKNVGASFGSFAVNDIKLQGTTVYIWAH